jgi:Ca2+-transporting ATPase
VSPEQKLDLIDLHQAQGEVVAMTGDGVNDAPALRSADIGVAMGGRGTEVAQEAADMVLQDDAFSTIVAAVEQGRVIFENIRKFVVYLLSGNVGEILAVGVAAAAGLALPLLPLQILYINIVNDVFPALALGLGPGTGQVMAHPPRDPDEPVITRGGWMAIGGYGVLIAAAVLGVFLYALWGLGYGGTRAVTMIGQG